MFLNLTVTALSLPELSSAEQDGEFVAQVGQFGAGVNLFEFIVVKMLVSFLLKPALSLSSHCMC